MLARGEPPLARLLPARARRVPGAACAAATLAELDFIEPEFDGPGSRRGIADPDRPGPIDRKLDVVFDHDRRLAAEGDHGKNVGVLLGERLRVAAVERPRRDHERGGRIDRRRRVLDRRLGSGRLDRERPFRRQEAQHASQYDHAS